MLPTITDAGPISVRGKILYLFSKLNTKMLAKRLAGLHSKSSTLEYSIVTVNFAVAIISDGLMSANFRSL